jgi:hypothetical protein
VVLVLAGWTGAAAHAQPVQQLTTGFEREVNRYRWTSNARFALRLAGWDVALTNRFLSDGFILFDDELRFRDEDQLTWEARRPLGARYTAHVRGRTAWFGLSRVLTQELYGGLRLAPRPFAWIEPVLGAAWDRRPGVAVPDGDPPRRLDAGPAFGTRLSLTPPPLDGYQLRLEGEGTWQRIAPRRGHTVRFHGAAERQFEHTRLASTVRLSSFRRDAYQAVSFLNRDAAPDRPPETIEATTSDTFDVHLELDAPFFRGVRLLSQADLAVNNRFIRTHRAPEETLFFETDFNRRAIDAEVGLLYEKQRVAVRLAAQGGAATERRQLANREDLPPAEASQKTNLLQQADYDEGVFGLQGNLQATLHPRLVLTFNGTSRIVRHDTPAANLDDRDEVSHNGVVGLLLTLSRYVQTDLKVFGAFYHTVYLNAERSAENNILRSLRLRPSMRWTPSPRTQIRFTTEVRATYTVDDFVLPGRRPTDQSARELRFETEVEQDLPGEARLFASGSYANLHLGRLLWNDFAEIPFDTLRTYSGWVHLQTGRRLVADVGLRLFIRSDFDRAATVQYARVDEAGNELRDETGQVLRTSITRPGRQWIEQIGPTTTITWMMGASTLRLDGWLNVQHVRHRLYGALPEASADLIRRAARRGTRKLIPNVALTVVWNL